MRPCVIVGIAPPYYPSVSDPIEGGTVRALLDGLSEFVREQYATDTEERPYLFATTDMSYVCRTDPDGDRDVLANLATPADLYDVPIDGTAELNIPMLIIGPACKSPHQIKERVYVPDVAERMPAIFRRIIEQVEESQ